MRQVGVEERGSCAVEVAAGELQVEHLAHAAEFEQASFQPFASSAHADWKYLAASS